MPVLTQPKQDDRYRISRLIRLGALIALACTVFFALYIFRDDLNIKGFKRGLNYLSQLAEPASSFSEYSFESGLNTVCVPLKTGLAAYTGDTLRYITNEPVYSLQLKYQNPTMERGKNAVLLYDRGGVDICIINGYMELMNTQLASPIITASLAPSGAMAVVTDELGFRAAVTVYNSRQDRIFKWQTPDFYVLDAAVSSDESTAAAICLSAENGAAVHSLKIFDLSGKKDTVTVGIRDDQVYSLSYGPDGEIIIITRNNVYIYSSSGEETYALEWSVLYGFNSPEGQLPMLFINTASGQGVQVVIPEVYSEARQSLPVSCDTDGNVLALIEGKDLVIIDLSDGSEEKYEVSGAKTVFVRPGEEPILVYAHRAETLKKEVPNE